MFEKVAKRLGREIEVVKRSDTMSHLATAMIAHTGGRSDAPDFHWLMIDAWCRCKPKAVLADAGYDSAKNHKLARERMGITSWIQASVGRPTHKPAADRHLGREMEMMFNVVVHNLMVV